MVRLLEWLNLTAMRCSRVFDAVANDDDDDDDDDGGV